jgi:PAP2 superfamily
VTDAPARGRLALLPGRVTADRAPKWWQEILFIVIVYELYSLTRNAVPNHDVKAFKHAHRLLGIEGWLHIDIERPVNSFVTHISWLAIGCNYYYSTLHFIVTIGVLVWLYRTHPLRYRPIRTVLIITNLIALLGFWFIAVAPPRMLPGFTDTLVKYHTWGSLESADVAKVSNQFAAMPSLHIGWSLWCAFVIVTLAKRTWVRILGALYPLATFFVIVGTANHYVLDAVAGAATLCLAVLIQRILSGRRSFTRPQDSVTDASPERELVSA